MVKPNYRLGAERTAEHEGDSRAIVASLILRKSKDSELGDRTFCFTNCSKDYVCTCNRECSCDSDVPSCSCVSHHECKHCHCVDLCNCEGTCCCDSACGYD